MSDALLPCPFCGDAPYVIDDDSYGKCIIGCHCALEPSVLRDSQHMRDCKLAWNTRAILSANEVGERVASPESPSPEGLGRSGVEAESIRRMAEYISDHSVFATTEAQAVARAYLALLALSPRAE